jgi:hypothetical protein
MSLVPRIPASTRLWVMGLMLVPVPGLIPADAAEARQKVVGVANPQCTMALWPVPIPRGEPRVTVVAQLSEDIGELQRVTPHAESGVEVSTARSAPGNRLRLTLNTTEARDGEWTITALGETGECIGELEVGPRSPVTLR